MLFDFMNKIRQHGLNIAEKFGIISVVLTWWVILVNYMFGLHLSQYLEKIPLIGQLVNIDLIEEFEDIQDGDLFYEELKSQLASLDIAPWNIKSVKVRRDNDGQETFRVTTVDGKEQEIIVKKEADSYITLKPLYIFYYRDGNVLKKDKKELVYVKVEKTDTACSGAVLTGSLDKSLISEPCEKCEECPKCDAGGSTIQAVSDRYDEWYQQGYDKWVASCPQVNTSDNSLSQIDQAAALCQKRVDAEYQRWLDEWYQNGYKVWESNGYERGFSAGQQSATEGVYQDGYDAGYSAGSQQCPPDRYQEWYDIWHQDGYDEGVNSCYTVSGP